MNVVKVSGILSRASGKPTKLIRVITDSTNYVLAAQKHGVKIGWLIYRCEPSKEPLDNASSVRNMGTPPLSVKTSSVACGAHASTE